MLNTDGYVYLHVNNPLSAWNTYRGVLASANVITKQTGCLSVWVADVMRRGLGSSLVERECNLERIRRSHYKEKISRSWGIYTFPDKETAERAPSAMQAPHMRIENLAEISLAEARRTSTHDSNWITYHSDDPNSGWINAYWEGKVCPGYKPLWERLVDGRIIILGTALREKAYKLIKQQFPNSMCWLEIARIAAWVGSDLGSIAAFIISRGENFAVDYYFNMEEANDEHFLKKVERYMQSGQPINHDDIGPHFKNGSFGSIPDFRAFSFSKPTHEMSYLGNLL